MTETSIAVLAGSEAIVQLEEKIRFALSTLRPMADYTLPYLASVFGVVDSRQGKYLGSGLRCIHDGRRLLITARHVLEAARDDAFVGTAVSAGYGVPPFIIEGRVAYSTEADLAICCLPEQYPHTNQIAFWPATRIDPSADPRATDYLFVHGFPGTRSHTSALLGGIVLKSLPYGAMQADDEDILASLEDFQFALYFDPREVWMDNGERADSLPDPHGMSGCPVWRVGASGRFAKDWTPELCSLIGIVTQWRTDSEVLVATSASKILDLVQNANV